VPAVLRGQPVHLQHGQPVHRQGADHQGRRPQDLLHYTDPLPQALVLTAIVISFAMTALFLVVLLASRGLTGTDHVDGRERDE
jgi:multisubunit Na+/H+ antiporter MnhC subunit